MGLRLLTTTLLAGLAATAAGVEQQLRTLSATTFEDAANGREYAYLLWTSPDPLTLDGAVFGVFAKPGAAGSPAPFVAQGTAQLQTNATVLDAILSGLPAELYEPAGANMLVDEMFGDIMPAGPLTLGTKLSVIMADAKANPESYRTLSLLGRTEPFIAICLGQAAAVELPANRSTFELRQRSAAGGEFDVVAGRVTLDHDAPPVLPAPPMPEQVVEDGPAGHLNAKLRWDITDELARVTPLTHGYNLYRITRGFAEGVGYDSTPPTAQQVADAIASFPTAAALVNTLPILAQDGDDLPFITDDNGVTYGEGDPFADGDEFFYYVAARDILGRPGLLSPGLLVQVCDRLPPGQPTGVKARDSREFDDASGDSSTHLEVRWEPSPTGDAPTGGYYVYRWDDPADMTADAASETPTASPVSPLIPHVEGLDEYTWLDDTPGAPTPETSARQTAWYSVRAVDATACGDLESGDSAPGWGVPRDFEGPIALGSSITISETCPAFDWQDPGVRELNGDPGFIGPTGDITHVEFKAERLDAAIKTIEWALSYDDPQTGERLTLPLGEGDYTPNVNALVFKRRIPNRFDLDNYFADFIFRVTDCTGKQVAVRHPAGAFLGNNGVQVLCVRIDMVTTETTIETGGVNDTLRASPFDPDGGINPPTITFTIPPTAEEYKLYKRIDGGPLLLMEQKAGVAPLTVEEIEDVDLPANASEICYFVQYFNADGSPSALAKIGCIKTLSRAPLPVPILAEVEATGDSANPQAILRWFCPREGVGKFRVYIGDDLTRVNADYSEDLTAQVDSYPLLIPGSPTAPGTRPEVAPYSGELEDGVAYFPYNTKRIGPQFGDESNPNEFSITLDVVEGREYHFYVRSIGATSNSDRGEPSNVVSFTWNGPDVDLAQVPWPARALPAVDDEFLPDLSATFLSTPGLAAVRIGDLKFDQLAGVEIGQVERVAGQGLSQTPSLYLDSAGYDIDLYSTIGGETVFPCVVYRVQVPNPLYPAVSGDVVQVSPLLEGIRTQVNEVEVVEIWDPFVNLAQGAGDLDIGVYFFDHQPVVEGATYKYLIVRFKDNGEIDRVLPGGQVTAPLVPLK